MAGPKRLQFSLRLLLTVTTVCALAAIYVAWRERERVKNARPIQFANAIKAGDVEEIDYLLRIDPGLAHGLQHYETTWSETALQMSLDSPEVFQRILKENPNIEEKSADGKTSLVIAVDKGRIPGYRMVPFISELLDRGADPNSVNLIPDPTTNLAKHATRPRVGTHSSPLQIAVQGRGIGRNLETIDLLLAAGADPNLNYRADDQSALHLALMNPEQSVVESLLDAGANIDATDDEGNTPLHLVAKMHRFQSGYTRTTEAARLLVRRGANIFAKNDRGATPLNMSMDRALRQNLDISLPAKTIWFEALARFYDEDRGAELNQLMKLAPPAFIKRDLIRMAASEGKPKILDFLLSQFDDPSTLFTDSKNTSHRASQPVNPLFFCSMKSGSPEAQFAVIRSLVNAGADVNVKRSDNGHSLLHSAAIRSDHVTIKALIENGADPNVVANDGTTVLDATFFFGFDLNHGPQTLRELIKGGHKPTPLYAATVGDLQLLKTFKKEDPESIDREYTEKKLTPLYAAVLANQVESTTWLLQQGVKTDVQAPIRTSGQSVLLFRTAMIRGNSEILKELIKAGVDPNQPLDFGVPPLHLLCMHTYDLNVFRVLLENGADPNLPFQGKTVREQLRQTAQSQPQRTEEVKAMLELLDEAETRTPI